MIDEVTNKILKEMTIAGNTYIAEQVARLLYEAGISIDGEWTVKPLAHTEDNLLCPHLARLEVKGLDFTEHDKKVIEHYLAERNIEDRTTNSQEVDKWVQHQAVCVLLNDIYQQKNTAYGDSFGETFRDLGIISAVTRISDKYNRLKTLARNTEIPQGDEAIADTLLDMANYCIMTYMELENEQNRENEM